MSTTVEKEMDIPARLSFRSKVSFLLIPIIIVISLVYTAEGIRSERAILRNEIIKKGETIAIIAARNAELPILSENMEILQESVRTLKEIPDVAFVQFLRKNFDPLIQEGPPVDRASLQTVAADKRVHVFEQSNHFEFFVPIATVKAKDEIAMLHDSTPVGLTSEPIGWARIGLSKEVMDRTAQGIVQRGVLLALVFSSIGGILMFALITVASRPVKALVEAVKGIREGEYPEIAVVSSIDEIGRLSSEFNRMSRAIRDREEKIGRMVEEIQQQNRNLDSVVRERTAQLETAYEELKQIDEVKSSFLSTVSHELRTPLTSVLGFARIIKKKFDEAIVPLIPPDHEKGQKAVRQIRNDIEIIGLEGERLTDLINDFLDLAKLEAGRMEWHMSPISMRDVIDRAAAAVNALVQQKGLTLVVEAPRDLPLVMGEKDRLVQVLINLISNAVKFTDRGALICRAREDGNEVIVSIIDPGIGIAPEHRDTVFDKFKQVGDTLTDRPKGSGLGLPISRQIVEHHGGRIWVDSEPGKGSTFSFSVAIAPPASGEGAACSLEHLVQQLKKHLTVSSGNQTPLAGSILVVDDDPHIRQMLRHELEAEGYAVREAENGRAALKLVEEEKPALIVLDVMMPEMNGFDVAAVFKNDPATMAIPIIIVSIIDDVERGSRLGIDRYFTKPVDMEKLLREVEVILANGPSHKRLIVLDDSESTLRILIDVLQAQGYSIVEVNDGHECIMKARALSPGMIIINTVNAERAEIIKTLRFEKGLEHVVFIILGEKQSDGEA